MHYITVQYSTEQYITLYAQYVYIAISSYIWFECDITPSYPRHHTLESPRSFPLAAASVIAGRTVANVLQPRSVWPEECESPWWNQGPNESVRRIFFTELGTQWPAVWSVQKLYQTLNHYKSRWLLCKPTQSIFLLWGLQTSQYA